MKFTVEHITRVWMDDSGESFEVGDDRDGLDMNEIRWRDRDGKIVSSVTFTDEQLPALINALMTRAKTRSK